MASTGDELADTGESAAFFLVTVHGLVLLQSRCVQRIRIVGRQPATMASTGDELADTEGLRKRAGDKAPMNEEELALERKRLEIDRREVELMKRELQFEKGQAARAQQTPPAEAVWVRPTGVYKTNPYKQIGVALAIPICMLLVLYPTLLWLHKEPVAATPCKGICSVSPEMLAAAPTGCMPETTGRLLVPAVVATHFEVIERISEALKHEKAFERMVLQNWRDALQRRPILLSGMAKVGTPDVQYEWMFRERLVKIMDHHTQHPRIMMGHVYFYDLNMTQMEEWSGSTAFLRNSSKATDEVRHVQMFREPIARMAAQYASDKAWDKGKEKSGWGGKTVISMTSFETCVRSSGCRRQYGLAKWCNAQTKHMCGWGTAEWECNFDPETGNATEVMLERALKHLRGNVSVVGIAEDLRASVGLLEKTHPTYFEGALDVFTKGHPDNCNGTKSQNKDAFCPFPESAELAYEMPADVVALLGHFCWADLVLYREAKKMFLEKTRACAVPVLPACTAQ
eukprot:CAMPEP_0180277356 /NCGR_PEP_ID=MMETSP0988-20121125/6884_1 /TAXON_ID=697907 /ORGANISM="non described non described, Strain CCMP2293" /LENGTH=512 /DNA_ID=CAMNT_0022248787 /DNA_START=124 /DNA_END=1662 /DNA_ORIENTATION=+